MTSSTLTRFVAACFLSLFILPSPLDAQSQQTEEPRATVKATYGDWDVVCATASPDRCVMRQVGTTADGETVLEVSIRKLEEVKTEDGQVVPAAMRIRTPLQTVLPSGVEIRVDGAESTAFSFARCRRFGCIANGFVSDRFLALLKRGLVAEMTFTRLRQGETTVNISLNGFTKAFDSL